MGREGAGAGPVDLRPHRGDHGAPARTVLARRQGQLLRLRGATGGRGTASSGGGAAVADWRVDASAQKIKKGEATPLLTLIENPDILATLAKSPRRPRLLIGFAAETENVIDHAKSKRARKGADWIVANDVSGDVMGGAANTVHIVTADGVESWERLPKDEVAKRLAERIAVTLDKAD